MWKSAACVVAVAVVLMAARPPALAQQTDLEETTTAACAPHCFIGIDGRLRDADRAYQRLVARGEPRYLRTWIEMGIALGLGTTWYWLDRERQVADWDYPSLKQRLTLEAWRFDNNPFDINFFWHTFNGLGFHVLGRSNELSLPAAAAVGLVTSLVWEIGLEFREKVSINDVITTTGAGVAAGEFLHWFGRYINSGTGDNIFEQALKWTLGLPRAIHNTLDDRIEYTSTPDNLGLNSDIWHRFDFSGGMALADVSRDGASVRTGARMFPLHLDARLAALPGYLRPGSLRRFFHEGNVTSLDLLATFTSDGAGVDAIADTMLLGYHVQNIPMPEQRGVGTAFTIGANIAYRYRREKFFGWRERLGVMHLPGLGVDAHVLGERFRLRASGRLNGDFAGINALAYPEWKAAHPDVVDKTILIKHGYYYAFGWSARAQLELAGPYFELGASVFYGDYDSKEGLDRSQETVTFDVDLDDRVLDYGAWLRLGPLVGGWRLGAAVSRRDRKGNVAGVPGSAVLDRFMLQLMTRL